MIDVRIARLRTHRNNIDRYLRLLQTTLTEIERRYLEGRLTEERSALQLLSASSLLNADQTGAPKRESPSKV